EELVKNDIIIPKKNSNLVFQYASYIKHLNYKNLSDAIRDWLRETWAYHKYIDHEQAALCVMHTLLELFLKMSAVIRNLEDWSIHENVEAMQMLLVHPSLQNLFLNIQFLSIDLKPERDHWISNVLPKTCRKLKSLSVRRISARDSSIQSLCPLLVAQHELENLTFYGGKCYYEILGKDLIHQADRLKLITLDRADMKESAPWTAFAKCKNLEVLNIRQCFNLTRSMVFPIFSANFSRLKEISILRNLPKAVHKDLVGWSREYQMMKG
ncbi:6723_t:CDS:2, partial [Acaulospora colombiana]